MVQTHQPGEAAFRSILPGQPAKADLVWGFALRCDPSNFTVGPFERRMQCLDCASLLAFLVEVLLSTVTDGQSLEPMT